MKIQVVGPGCIKCLVTEKRVITACQELGLAADISHVSDWRQFAKLGVRMTPAVVVDGKVVISGRVPTVDELKELLSKLSR